MTCPTKDDFSDRPDQVCLDPRMRNIKMADLVFLVEWSPCSVVLVLQGVEISGQRFQFLVNGVAGLQQLLRLAQRRGAAHLEFDRSSSHS